MIDYIRTEWYGLHYFLHFKGVLVPRLLPVIILSGVISAIVASNKVDGMDWCKDDGSPLFEHPYAFQLFGIVFGYMSVARLNISISRYFEGVTVRRSERLEPTRRASRASLHPGYSAPSPPSQAHAFGTLAAETQNIKIMHSKWGDAALQIIVFDRLTDDDMQLDKEPFSMHVIRQFKQLSALATMHLHGEALKRTPAGRRTHTVPISLAEVGRSNSATTLRPQVHQRAHDGLRSDLSSVAASEASEVVSVVNSVKDGVARALKGNPHEDMKELHNLFDPTELDFFDGMADSVQAQLSRILRTITTRQQAGGVKAPAPIVSRVFQELSNGVLAYNNACKMKEVPVPFALVHFGAVLLAFFNFTAPVVIACFTGNLVMSIVSSVIVVSGFSALWLVANELEDPFGYDANDMPMLHYHEEFCHALEDFLRRPWMAKDRWTVMTGENPNADADAMASHEMSPDVSPVLQRRDNATSSSAAPSSAVPPTKV